MILIDTNVISELMRPRPSQAVLEWFGLRDARDLFLSAVGEAELRRGAAMLEPGTRRERLISEIDAVVGEDFEGRVLPFDSRAAKAFALIFAERRRAGRPIGFPACQIAATARAQGAAIATRNTSHFEGCGIAVLDPWGFETCPARKPHPRQRPGRHHRET